MKCLLLMAILVTQKVKFQPRGNIGLILIVTDTGSECNMAVSTEDANGNEHKLYEGKVYGSVGFNYAVQAANFAANKFYKRNITEDMVQYTVTHVKSDESKIGPFKGNSSLSIETDIQSATGLNFTQLCPFQGCFSSESTVITSKGKMNMTELFKSAKGIKVLTAGGHFSPVTFWIHAESQLSAEFLRITTSNGDSINLTGGHLIFKTNCERLKGQLIRSEKVSPGDCLMVDRGDGKLVAQRVVKVDKFDSVGFYSPATGSGNLLVDNILASCYSEVENILLQPIWFDSLSITKSAPIS